MRRPGVGDVAGFGLRTAISGTAPVPCQFMPVSGLIDRANGMAMWTAALIGNGKELRIARCPAGAGINTPDQ